MDKKENKVIQLITEIGKSKEKKKPKNKNEEYDFGSGRSINFAITKEKKNHK